MGRNRHIIGQSVCIGTCSVILGLLGPSAVRAGDDPAHQAAQRAPVPDAAAQARGLKEIHEIFKNEFEMKSSADKSALARKLIRQSEDPATSRTDGFLLLQQARELAIESGDAAAAIWATSRTTEIYAVDEPRERFTTLRRCVRGAVTPRANAALAIGAIGLFDDRAAADDLDDAGRAVAIAGSAAKRSDDLLLTQACHDREAKLPQLRSSFQRYQKAAAALRGNPNSHEDDLAVGEFLCFTKGDWLQGLPALARGTDATLKELATKDLSSPAAAEAQMSLANAWWDATSDVTLLPEARQRAAYWYQRALPGLKGLGEILARRRIDEIQSAGSGSGRIVDLLARFDPTQDVIHGKWTFSEDTLSSAGDSDARVELPYVPGEAYDFRVVFTRLSGNQAFDQLCRFGDQSFEWEIGFGHNTTYGFQDINGTHIDGNLSAVRVPKCIENGRFYVSIVKVRRGRVEGWVNGKMIKTVDLAGARLSIPPEWLLRHAELLGVGSYESPTVFHEIEVIEVTGTGKLAR